MKVAKQPSFPFEVSFVPFLFIPSAFFIQSFSSLSRHLSLQNSCLIFLLFFTAVIFVVDSANRERINEAHEELAKLMAEKRLKDALILVFANKQVCDMMI